MKFIISYISSNSFEGNNTNERRRKRVVTMKFYFPNSPALIVNPLEGTFRAFQQPVRWAQSDAAAASSVYLGISYP